MVRYKFKLKKTYMPSLTRSMTERNNLYGGVYLKYSIRKQEYINIFGLTFVYWVNFLGTKVFLNPYKKYWDKKNCFLPHAYWGKPKHPLTRLWVVLTSNTIPQECNKIITEISLISHTVKLFNCTFLSKDITSNLFKKKDKFYINNQNQKNHERRKKCNR